MKTIQVTYSSWADFKVPDNVFLLSKEKNNEDSNVVGSWWVKWNVLSYVDENLDVQHIEAGDIDTECKHPDTVEIIEDE